MQNRHLHAGTQDLDEQASAWTVAPLDVPHDEAINSRPLDDGIGCTKLSSPHLARIQMVIESKTAGHRTAGPANSPIC